MPLLLFRCGDIKSSYRAAKNWTLGAQLSPLEDLVELFLGHVPVFEV